MLSFHMKITGHYQISTFATLALAAAGAVFLFPAQAHLLHNALQLAVGGRVGSSAVRALGGAGAGSATRCALRSASGRYSRGAQHVGG